MKYIVEVNAKYLVSIEAETQLRAEHTVLELDGIWGALAFDRDAMKTDTFAGAVQGCEMVSMKKLEAMSAEYRGAYYALTNAQDAMTQVDAEIADLEKRLAALRATKVTVQNGIDTANALVARANETIGIRKN